MSLTPNTALPLRAVGDTNTAELIEELRRRWEIEGQFVNMRVDRIHALEDDARILRDRIGKLETENERLRKEVERLREKPDGRLQSYVQDLETQADMLRATVKRLTAERDEAWKARDSLSNEVCDISRAHRRCLERLSQILSVIENP